MRERKSFPRPRERPVLWCIGLFSIIMLAASACGWKFPEQHIIFFNRTESVPLGFYLRVPLRPLVRGDYVVYEPTELTRRYATVRGYSPKATSKFLKRVGAVAGDAYCIDPDTHHFTIEGTYIGEVFQRDRMDRPLPQQQGTFIVPEDFFLPIGETSRSFDGRYTGVVPTGSIVALVVPLLTWW
nr:S26 family signal peptidase [uncultured Selenomonas sp.]